MDRPNLRRQRETVVQVGNSLHNTSLTADHVLSPVDSGLMRSRLLLLLVFPLGVYEGTYSLLNLHIGLGSAPEPAVVSRRHLFGVVVWRL